MYLEAIAKNVTYLEAIAKDVTYLEDVCYPKKNIVLELLWPEVHKHKMHYACVKIITKLYAAGLE